MPRKISKSSNQKSSLLQVSYRQTLKKIGQTTAVIVLMLGLSASGYYAGNKSVPRAFVIDPNSGKPVAITTDRDITIYIIGPSGIEPGIGYARSKDGSKIIVVPPEAFQPGPDSLAPQGPGPDSLAPQGPGPDSLAPQGPGPEQQHSSPLEPHLPPVART